MCSFGSCKTRFEFLSQFRKVRNAFECFVTQVQTRLPKTKRVWPMKINVICSVFVSLHDRFGVFCQTILLDLLEYLIISLYIGQHKIRL